MEELVAQITPLRDVSPCSLALTALADHRRVSASNRQNQSDSGKPEVLTTTVLADLHAMWQGAKVQSIVKPGSEIHGYQPTPSDIERASQADLIVENGLGLELGPEFGQCGQYPERDPVRGDGSSDRRRRLRR